VLNATANAIHKMEAMQIIRTVAALALLRYICAQGATLVRTLHAAKHYLGTRLPSQNRLWYQKLPKRTIG